MVVTSGSKMMDVNHYKLCRVRVALNGLVYPSKLLQFNGGVSNVLKDITFLFKRNRYLIHYFLATCALTRFYS